MRIFMAAPVYMSMASSDARYASTFPSAAQHQFCTTSLVAMPSMRVVASQSMPSRSRVYGIAVHAEQIAP
ncbi:hypothetical protein [Xanthomonas sp. 3075]|uniref:hypothetical protein n=1 Tax=Xanthomonas sp. 3075 TaxID=3035315 RepID=UPI00161489E1|nr:hypothetical protein [Xanthomonas sp. 3075]MBB4131456.1 hypothetical protein [Xanthomonas sp. 3075]